MLSRLVTNSPSRRDLLRAMPQRLRADSLVRNSLYMMLTTLLNSVFGYLFWIIAARTNTPSAVGLAGTFIPAITLASSLSCAGISSTLIYMLPGLRAGRDRSMTWSAGLCLGMVTGSVAGVATLVFFPLISPRFSIVVHDRAYGSLILVGILFWTLQSLLDNTFVAERVGQCYLLRNGVAAICKNLLILGLAVAGGTGTLSLLGAMVGASAISVLGGLMLVFGLRRGYRIVLGGTLKRARSMASALTGHHLINLGGIAPMYVLPMLVTAQLSAADNAYFYTTWMIGGIFMIISPAVSSSLFAEGAYLKAGLRSQVRSSAITIGALLAPAMVAFFIFGHYMLAIFGEQYAVKGFELLTLLILSAIPDAITNIYVAVLRVRRNLYHAAILNNGMAGATLVLAWFLLPRLGLAGAGWAWLAAQCLGSLAAAVHAWFNRPLSNGGARASLAEQLETVERR